MYRFLLSLSENGKKRVTPEVSVLTNVWIITTTTMVATVMMIVIYFDGAVSSSFVLRFYKQKENALLTVDFGVSVGPRHNSPAQFEPRCHMGSSFRATTDLGALSLAEIHLCQVGSLKSTLASKKWYSKKSLKYHQMLLDDFLYFVKDNATE